MRTASLIIAAILIAVIGFFANRHWTAKENYEKAKETLEKFQYNMVAVDESEYMKWLDEYNASERKWKFPDQYVAMLKSVGFSEDLDGLKRIREYALPEWSFLDIKANQRNVTIAILKGISSPTAIDGNMYYYAKDGHVAAIAALSSNTAKSLVVNMNGEIMQSMIELKQE
jgi:hypothetical protein